MRRCLPLLLMCCLSAAPVRAAEDDAARPRLVTGGMGRAQQTELASFGAASLGTLNDGWGAAGRMALGGYAAYAFQDGMVQSALQRGPQGGTAHMTASYMGQVLGIDGVASVRLGYDWVQGNDPGGFSLNPAQTALSELGGSDMSLTLSFTHDVSPLVSLGGYAATWRGDDGHDPSALRIGAGMGLKF